MNSSSVKQVVTGTIMELIICALTSFLIYQFVQGVKDSKRTGQPIVGIAIFCLVLAIVAFIGLNILMIFLIRKMKGK